ncbi:MAG: metallophosphoesterase family protein [Nannocystales bacterium]
MRVPLRILPLVASLLVSCKPAPTTTTPPQTQDAADASCDEETPAAASVRETASIQAEPVKPDVQSLRAAALAAAGVAALQPKPRKAGRRRAMPSKGVQRIANWRALRGLKPKGEPQNVDWAAMYFTVLPWVTLSPEGMMTMRWETRTSSPAGSGYVGLRVEEDPFSPPRYRNQELETRRRKGRVHEISGDISGLFKPKYDVNNARTRGYGELSWQLEQFQPELGTTVLAEGRSGFRLEPKGEHFELVQLPTVVLGPFVHQVSQSRFIVSFETDVATTAAVAVADRTPTVSKEPSRRHEITVDGLEAGTAYAYQVAVCDGVETSAAPPRTVRTRRSTGPVRIAILSDSRSGVGPGREAYAGVNATVLAGLLGIAQRRGVEAVFFPGDLIDGYSTHVDDYVHEIRTWQRVAEPVAGSIPIYTGMGNHEAIVDMKADGVSLSKPGEDSAEARFASLMVNPSGAPAPETEGAPSYDETVYSVDLGDVHLVMLNTNYWRTSHPGHPRNEGKGNREGFIMDGQMKWLEEDLSAARAAGAKQIVVMGHEPSFPVGGHIKDAMWWNGEIEAVNTMRERFWSILAEHDVLAYVSGDEHNYSRALIGPETVSGAKNSVYSVISGGSGAPYYAKVPPKEYAGQVQAFSAQQHVTLWTFEEGKPPHLEVVGLSGDVIESVDLTGAGPGAVP